MWDKTNKELISHKKSECKFAPLPPFNAVAVVFKINECKWVLDVVKNITNKVVNLIKVNETI